MVSWRISFSLGALALAVALSAAAVIFQDNITLFSLNPRTPFQTDTPPPPPAYGARGAWALWPDDLGAGDADIFYVHSTTYASRTTWNASVTDNVADAVLRRAAAPNEAGPFMRTGAVYGPRYRQATLYASFTHKFDGLAAHELAFRDVETAFLHFLAERPINRPFILVGYGQGGLHVEGLLQYYVAENDSLRRNLAAAYIIQQGVAVSVFDNAFAAIPPCTSKAAVRCIVSYIDLESGFENEKERHRKRVLIWNDRRELVSLAKADILCVNPISWQISETVAGPEGHLGAASATGLRMRETPAPVASATSAQCRDGVLAVNSPRQEFLRRRHWFGDQWRPQDFNLFYHDLADDAGRRVTNLNARLAAEAVDLVAGPDDKGPK